MKTKIILILFLIQNIGIVLGQNENHISDSTLQRGLVEGWIIMPHSNDNTCSPLDSNTLVTLDSFDKIFVGYDLCTKLELLIDLHYHFDRSFIV